MRCPGEDSMFWKPGDVFEISCPKCGFGVEFFKFDVKRKCRCGHEIVNPQINFGCAEWCPFGDSCIEGLPEDIKAKTKAEKDNRLRERISQEMRNYFGADTKRIDHALKVAQWAEQILKMEGGNPLVVLGAAYLHDIGIKKAEEKYGSAQAEYQEKEGPEVAREILTKLNVPRGITAEICDIIGHHHHPRSQETLNFQIVYEADWLVNLEERCLIDLGEGNEIVEKNFKTVTGKKLIKQFMNKVC